MSTEIVLAPREKTGTSSVAVEPTSSNVSICKAFKKKISKPFVAKKVALLKAAVADLAEDIKRKEDMLDNAIDQVKSLEKQKGEINDATECVSSKNEITVRDIEEQIKEEKTIREKEQEKADEDLESLQKETKDEVIKLKVQVNQLHANVWSVLNGKLDEFKTAAKAESVQLAADRSAPLEVKGKQLVHLQKERRSVRKILNLMFK